MEDHRRHRCGSAEGIEEAGKALDRQGFTSEKKRAWEGKAAAWDANAEDPDNMFTKLAGAVADLVARHRRSGRVLDVGCGPGLLCANLSDLGFDVWGCDLSETMIKFATARLRDRFQTPGERFKVSGDGEVPFEGIRFDVITAIQVFPYVEDYSAFARLLGEYLAPGGVLVASNTNRVSLHVAVAVARRLRRFPVTATVWKEIGNLVRTGYPSGGHVDPRSARQVYSSAKFDRLLGSAGYRRTDAMEWFHFRPLDRNPLDRRGLSRFLAKRLAWYHVGVYRKENAAVRRPTV